MGLPEVQRHAATGDGGSAPLLWEADGAGLDLRNGRAESLAQAITDAVADYGQAEFNAGRADATEYVRAQYAAEAKRERLLALIYQTIHQEETECLRS